MKLFLDKKEKHELILHGSITIEREAYMNEPKTSILHGIGVGSIFDKIDYKWVFGDTSDYIEKMKNIGRRGVDYKDNSRNTWSGSNWFEFPEKHINPYGCLNKTIVTGSKNVYKYSIQSIFITRLDKLKSGYLKPILSIVVKNELC